jgi:hypothetical protein
LLNQEKGDKLMKWYRYVDAAEESFIRHTGIIKSDSGSTYYATDPACNSSDEACRKLAIPWPKHFMIGPIPQDELPDFDVVPPRTVNPIRLPDGTWLPGGGTEAATSKEYRCFGHYPLR